MTCYKKEIKERKKETLLFFGYKESVSFFDHTILFVVYRISKKPHEF